jgi:GNAT superfamily N-acetyltransferase
MLEQFYNSSVLEKQIGTDHIFLICTCDGEDAGFAAFSPIAPDTFKLHKLYVAPQMHSLGIGKALLTEVISRLRSAGMRQLNLNVNRYNKKAIEFYYKFGFNCLYDEDIEIGNGYQMNDHVLGIKIA